MILRLSKRDVAAKKKAIMENEQYKKDLAEYDKAKALADVYDRAVKLLDAKTGIPVKIMESAFAVLEETCNKKAEALKSHLKISFENCDGVGSA